jgi:hypothetical protein
MQVVDLVPVRFTYFTGNITEVAWTIQCPLAIPDPNAVQAVPEAAAIPTARIGYDSWRRFLPIKKG